MAFWRISGARAFPERLLLAGILVLGLGLRLALTPFGGFPGDVRAFRGWAVQLVNTPLRQFYAAPSLPADHLPGDLWLLWGVAHLYRLVSPQMAVQRFGFLFLLKLVPSLADLGIALLLFLIARRLAGPRAGLLAAAGYALNPAAIFVSSIWGQWDSVSALAMVVALWLLLRGDIVWALPVLTYAALVKPQMALLFPLLALAWWRWPATAAPRGRRFDRASRPWQFGRLALGGLCSLAVFLAVGLPFSVGLPLMPTHWTIFNRLNFALNRYLAVSLNAFNLWGILAHAGAGHVIPDQLPFVFGISYWVWGERLFAAAVLGSLALFYWRPSRELALWTAYAIFFSLFMLPTRVHERYLMPAVVLCVALAAVVPAFRWLAVALTLTDLANLVAVYHYSDLAGFRSTTPHADVIVLAVSSVNLFLLLTSYAYGVALARAAAPLGEPDAPQLPTGVASGRRDEVQIARG